MKFPDTTKDFENLDQLASYSRKKQQYFERFCDSMIAKENATESAILSVNSAQREFYRLLEILYFKQLRKFPRNRTTIAFLPFLADKGGVDIKERQLLFDSFPDAIKNSETGMKTWNKINDYLYDKNIGKTTTQFSTLELLDPNGSISFYPQVVDGRHRYFILVFGASWCKPCILDEKQLKAWFHLIDTAEVKVVGLSIDNKKDRWHQYLEKENLPWNAYLLNSDWNNALVQFLNVRAIPSNLLLDSNGTVLLESNDIRIILSYLSNMSH